MGATIEQVLLRDGLTAREIDAVDLRSCFPCVPKMARRLPDLQADRPPTVHGGPTFGGGPLATCMMHAAAAMVREFRGDGHIGLLYGDAGFCTGHHALVLADHPIRGVVFPQNHSRQAEADAMRGPLRPFGDDHEGPVTLETDTVLHDRKRAPGNGVVISRDPHGARVPALVPGDDGETPRFLTDGRAEPVGTSGRTTRIGGTLRWQRARQRWAGARWSASRSVSWRPASRGTRPPR